MKPTLRTYQNENDYWQIREFLREVPCSMSGMTIHGRFCVGITGCGTSI